MIAGAATGEVLLLHGRAHWCAQLQHWLDHPLGHLLPRSFPWHQGRRKFRFWKHPFFNFTFISQPWSFIFRKLGVGDHLVSRQHRRLRRSHLWDDEDQEDLPPPRTLCQRLRRHCWHSQRHPQLHSLELVCVSDFEFHLFHYIYMKMLWSRCVQKISICWCYFGSTPTCPTKESLPSKKTVPALPCSHLTITI